jgi:predicted nucleic acid-binding protein
VTFGRSSEERDVLILSRRLRLAVYDASYLELAGREGVPLATLDTDLIRAARAQNMLLLRVRRPRGSS